MSAPEDHQPVAGLRNTPVGAHHARDLQVSAFPECSQNMSELATLRMQRGGAISGERGTGEGEAMRAIACYINKSLIYCLAKTCTSAANAQKPSVQVQQMEVASEIRWVRGVRGLITKVRVFRGAQQQKRSTRSDAAMAHSIAMAGLSEAPAGTRWPMSGGERR
jgi:hypothetical protein